MSLYVEGPRHYRVTDENQGAKVLAAAYIMMCQTILSVLARGGIKFTTARKWGWDDSAAAIASLFAVAHSADIAASYRYGMGQKMSAGGSRTIEGLLQTFYASNVLYLMSILFAKTSIILFIKRLTPSRNAHRVCWAFLTFLGLLGLSALLVTLFACGLPEPWLYQSDQCVDLTAFTRTIGIIDTLTDILLVALPVYLFSRVQYVGSGRWTVIVVFSLRALIVIPGVLRFIAVPKAFDWSSHGDASWYVVPFLTWESVTVHFSVISASIPCVRPFLRSLESGLYDVSLKAHPRLARASEDADKNLMLMTLSGFSIRRGMDRKPGGSIETDTTLKRPLRSIQLTFDRADSPEVERQASISSEVEFSQKLHPERSWHQTRIQSMRTYPQFGKLAAPSVESSQKKKSGETDRWHIAVTKETNIRFEEEGVVLQELNSSMTNHQDDEIRSSAESSSRRTSARLSR